MYWDARYVKTKIQTVPSWEKMQEKKLDNSFYYITQKLLKTLVLASQYMVLAKPKLNRLKKQNINLGYLFRY